MVRRRGGEGEEGERGRRGEETGDGMRGVRVIRAMVGKRDCAKSRMDEKWVMDVG